MVSTAALVADLLGYDPDEPGPRGLLATRPTVEQVLARASAEGLAGEVIPARDGARPVAVVILPDGRAYAVDDRCPHDGGWLSDGWVDLERDTLVCARHNWEIDPCTGTCDRGQGIRAQELLTVRSLLRCVR